MNRKIFIGFFDFLKETKGFTQEQFADSLDYSRGSIAKIIRGSTKNITDRLEKAVKKEYKKELALYMVNSGEVLREDDVELKKLIKTVSLLAEMHDEALEELKKVKKENAELKKKLGL